MPLTIIGDGPSGPAQSIVALTLANSVIPTTKAVLCGTAGTLNGLDEFGVVFTGLPLQQGYNPLRVSQVSTGGTAANLWGLY